MRLQFEDDDLQRLYTDATFHLPSVGPELGKSFRKKVQLLAAATDERDIRNVKSLRLEKLEGVRAGQHSIRLNDQFRLILRFETDDQGRLVIVIELTDYH